MSSTLKKLGTVPNLAPGTSVTNKWNNAASLVVWYIQAIPLESSFTGFDPKLQEVKVEVTGVQRVLNRTPHGGTGDIAWNYEHEIWYTIKNIGTKEVDVDVYASIIS